LMTLPLWKARPTLRDRVPGSDKKIATRAKKFSSLSPEYADGANTRFWAAVNDTSMRLPNLKTRMSPCLPFESGRNCLPGMEALAEMVQ
jgi:hypothetical protein